MSLRKKFNEEHSEVDTGPLNDILFILMFFFLIIATLANPNIIKLTNPKYKSETKSKQSIVVSIRGDGRTYIGQQAVIFDSLFAELSKRIDKKDSTVKQAVVINADTSVSVNKLVMIMRDAKKAGASSASLSVDGQ
ncbi:ExbD/TolR family protein [Ferruginibacter sp.]|jgi:biopolymer transport protein ExbD